jgi:hypothetical protein
MLEQSLPKISCQNEPSNNPSLQMQGHNNRNRIASQKIGGNSCLVAFPRYNRGCNPQSIQPVPMTHDNDNDDDSDIVIVKR